ncbi:hypothetical protein KI688_004342 [Linnemannia hyalina]|uniref:Uncharacterized protein n=1 Tax=Linnemannia hyalina TaxID=64524 RepID=A0A9P8BPS3_9FUNG|nr:hypothetical protein KI688_004342 [Linnemannia hyalina]
MFFERQAVVRSLPKIPYTYMARYPSKTKTNITFKTAGKSSKEHQKRSFKFKFHNDYSQTFYHSNIKLRSMVMDPAMMREKVYIDMLNSAGIPSKIKKSFLKQSVRQGDGKTELGSLVQMNAWNENKLRPNTKISYVSEHLGKNPNEDPLKDLIELMKFLQDFDPASTPRSRWFLE